MRTVTRLALAGLLAFGFGLAATPAAFAKDYPVVIESMKFGPVPAELHPGDTIVWKNKDIFRHSATARDKSFDIDLPVNAEVRMTFGPAGTVDFFCKFHPGMTGRLVISP